MTKLPESVAEIARVIGRDQALYLVGQLPTCGSRPWRKVLYVPAHIPPNHWLVRVIGWDDAQRISREFRGCILELSTCSHMVREHRNRAIRAEAACGVSVESIAARYGIGWRLVHYIIAAKTPEDEQPTRRHSPRL